MFKLTPVMQASFAVGRTSVAVAKPIAINVAKRVGPVVLQAGKASFKAAAITAGSVVGLAIGAVVCRESAYAAIATAKAAERGYVRTIRRLHSRLNETSDAAQAAENVAPGAEPVAPGEGPVWKDINPARTVDAEEVLSAAT